MHTHPLFYVDAFTERAFAGNACAIVLDAHDLSEATCLMIAREMNQAETAFVHSVDDGGDIARVVVRYFTPAEEIPLAGHPTVATAALLASIGCLTVPAGGRNVIFELRDGPVQVHITHEDGALPYVRMTQRKPVFMRKYPAELVAPVFGLSVDDLMPTVPVQTVSTGTPQLMIPVVGHDALRRACLQLRPYTALQRDGDFFSPHLFCLGGMTALGNTSARHFGIPPDIYEDPVTGSATGGMGAYLWAYRLIESASFVAEQGHWMQRPGRVDVSVHGRRADIESVSVGGAAIIVGEGHLRV